MNDAKVQDLIRAFFEDNYNRLLVEGGAHVLTPSARKQAQQQVEYYWRKMREVALSVTDTEVRLQLPNQKTPKGRQFVIEGVVDLVREGNRLRMYDIKTHHCEEVRAKLPSYAAQLNVYAYIWRHLRGQEMHEMGVIAVQLPQELRKAIAERVPDQVKIRKHFEAWNPLVGIDPDEGSIQAIFDEIASTVDRIEDGEFAPAPIEKLREGKGKERNREVAFATLHCRNCDGRYSCESYRTYVKETKGQRGKLEVLGYLDGEVDEDELEEWLDDNLDAMSDDIYG